MCISTSGDSICFELYKSELIFEIRISIEVGDYKKLLLRRKSISGISQVVDGGGKAERRRRVVMSRNVRQRG